MKDVIQKFLDRAVEDKVFPGCTCAIVSLEGVKYYCSGKKSVYPNEEKNSIDTIYDLASLTKVICTTTIILKLIQEKKITYYTKVSEILLDFQNEDICIYHLLTHTSGLPADLGWDFHISKEQIYKDIYHYSNRPLTLGDINYSDIGFMLLGEIIEKITNKSLDKAFLEYVVYPLDMKNTMYCPRKDIQEYIAPTEICHYTGELLKGIVHDRKARCCHNVAGHAGVFSNVEDLVSYVKMILHKGFFNHKQYLDSQYIDDMAKCWAETDGLKRGIGYLINSDKGIFSKMNSVSTIVHTGFSGTSLLIDIEKHIGIILLSNRIHPSRDNTKILEWRKLFHEYVMNNMREIKL